MSAAPSDATPTHTGSCHCGHVTYTGSFDLVSGHIIKCNCSICHKKGYFLLSPTSTASFSLLTPTSESELADYQFAKKLVHHYACPKCSTSVYISGFFEMGDEEIPFMAVMANTLDKRLDGEPLEDLRKVKIKYIDGRHDKLELLDEPFPGGAW
ncbi:glutathione-dependent formaldehyde-activating [Lophium mytilinum]|uniref:Glutathione-dependent formaldehyde-activating n=1 Tax=Lophium mytilinum TaxID=390894 RepID=A0A6A6QG81_9PEZI|nr:glutathione-dependent formaldehyde-activating [Lophium mytilinum]